MADEGEEPRTVCITYGYSRDHRPDLKQWVMNLVCADSGGIPLFFAPGNGNQSDQAALVRRVALYREGLVLDVASHTRENLQTVCYGLGIDP